MPEKSPRGRHDAVVPLRRTPKYEAMLPQILEMAKAGSGIDLISRARGIGAAVVRNALHLHQTGKRRPGRVDGRRRRPRQAGQPFEPKYQQIAAGVDCRRKAGEGFDRLAREMKVSRGAVLRAYDFANRDEAAAAAREGRKPTRPPHKWSEGSRAAKRKPRNACLQLEPVAPAGACATGLPNRAVAWVEVAVEQGALVRVARVGLAAARVDGRTLISSMPTTTRRLRSRTVWRWQ